MILFLIRKYIVKKTINIADKPMYHAFHQVFWSWMSQ